MANVTINAGSIGVVTTATANLVPTVIAQGIAGATITAGAILYADPAANNALRIAVVSDPIHAANVVGVALSNASVNQPVGYATAGDVTFGSVLTGATVYALSTSGGLAPQTDLGTGSYVTLIGIGNGGTASGTVTNLRLNISPAAVRK